MKTIPLTKGQTALVDDEDHERLSKWKWYCTSDRYAARSFHGKTILMHREICASDIGHETDHKNHDTLDNRKKNLRVCNYTQNHANMKKREGSSKYKGVSFFKRDGKWRTQIMISKRYIHLGLFLKEIEAAKAYDQKAIELFGEFALLNFPISK